MPFVSKFGGHGRIPGIHTPSRPPTPAVANTATTVNSLTFTISNYVANWVYSATISPSAGTISFSGATISVTGLNASTSYTLTLTARNSGGFSTNTASATTATPPPFFPSFAPFFPFFPSFPFFPFFPSFPFFPFFPSFPFFPFFPFFPNFPPPKVAPADSLVGIKKVQLLTSEYGYLEAKYLTENDALTSITLDGLNTESISLGEETYTEVKNIESTSSIIKMYTINNDIYPENTYLLCEVNSIKKFINVSEIEKDNKIFNFSDKDFIDIEEISVEDISSLMYNIECEPNNYYVIQSSLGYFS